MALRKRIFARPEKAPEPEPPGMKFDEMQKAADAIAAQAAKQAGQALNQVALYGEGAIKADWVSYNVSYTSKPTPPPESPPTTLAEALADEYGRYYVYTRSQALEMLDPLVGLCAKAGVDLTDPPDKWKVSMGRDLRIVALSPGRIDKVAIGLSAGRPHVMVVEYSNGKSDVIQAVRNDDWAIPGVAAAPR